MVSIETRFHGRDVKFSPSNPALLVVVVFDPLPILSGGPLKCGHLIIVNEFQSPDISIVYYSTSEGLNECAWSKFNPEILIAAGSDTNVKLWTIGEGNLPTIYTFEDDKKIYSSIWSPKDGKIFACAGHGILHINDIRIPRFVTIAGFGHDVRSCDWCKYNETRIATVDEFDGHIRVGDIRYSVNPCSVSGIEPTRVINTDSSHLRYQEEIQISSCLGNLEVALWNYRVEAHQQRSMFIIRDLCMD
ncbi:uncharacterized protein LOC131246922 [Magnolia sinica]|uniref:uncharacterized protein LOC131246922 n=1 Tax=Magnolia sinica TaxID=86752 RepID=UPI002658ECE1|nr:uncharacterized protein LOC131246922 [Magnolia sinica]